MSSMEFVFIMLSFFLLSLIAWIELMFDMLSR